MNLDNVNVRGCLSVIVVIGGGVLLANGDADLRMVVASMVTIVLQYWFGTSKSSGEKDAVIAKQQDVQTEVAKSLAAKVLPLKENP